jgi:hypothetical protein
MSDFLDTCTYDEGTLPWHDILELSGAGLTEKDVSEKTIYKWMWRIGRLLFYGRSKRDNPTTP